MGLKTSTLTFEERCEKSLNDTQMQAALKKAQDSQWIKREASRADMGDWEEWRKLGQEIRQHTLNHLPDYLEMFAENVQKQGGHVLFAQTEEEAREYVK